MRKKSLFLFIFLFISLFAGSGALAADKVNIKLFYSPSCKSCLSVKQEYLPRIISKYRDKINIRYINVVEPEGLKIYVALGKKLKKDLKVPMVLIGYDVLIGKNEITAYLEDLIEKHIRGRPAAPGELELENTDLLHKFKSFSCLTVIIAGLVDGINPCAFTVLIFFISFLTLMGYRKRGLLAVGLSFILAVFLTYLAIGLGLFRGLYELSQFYTFLRVVYYITAGICFILAYFNLRDYIIYKKTKNTDAFKVKLPKAVRQRINSIISVFYRVEPRGKVKSGLLLIIGTFAVGFLVSLLEAICTGQVYLPVIVFILKEPNLRTRAIAYLLLYNFMFVVPLFLILFAALLGMGSKKIGEFFKNRIALIKVLMFALFFGLGMFLILGL